MTTPRLTEFDIGYARNSRDDPTVQQRICDELLALRRENERLRAALKAVAVTGVKSRHCGTVTIDWVVADMVKDALASEQEQSNG